MPEIIPVEGETDRFWVTSETDGQPWLVDLNPGPELPFCACAIEHNRTAAHWNCRHLRAVKEWLKTHQHPHTVPPCAS